MADGTENPQRWVPITDLVDLAHLGKLGEESGELSSIIARCIIQGIDGVDPSTGKPNRIALQDEIADVRAMSYMAIDRFNLSLDEIDLRANRKIIMKQKWHNMILEDKT